jgi:tight adherence protein B
MTPAALIISLGVGSTVMLTMVALARFITTPYGRAQDRLAALGRPTGDIYEREVDLMSGSRPTSRLDALTAGSWGDGMRDSLERAGVPLRVSEYIAIRVFLLVFGLFVGFMAAGSFDSAVARLALPAIALVVAAAIPPLLLAQRRKRRAEMIEEQLVEFCDVMASMLQSGFGYVQALTATRQQLEAPLADELQRMLDAVRLGGNTDEALDDINRRLGSRDFDMIATAISIQRQSGGNLAEILRGVGVTIRERRSFYRDLKSMTAKERFSAVIVAGFPLVLAGGLMLLAGDPYRLLLTDPRGQIVLGAALALDFAGYVVISRVTKIEV